MSDVIELFGETTVDEQGPEWEAVLRRQWCPFLDRKCIKVRKEPTGNLHRHMLGPVR